MKSFTTLISLFLALSSSLFAQNWSMTQKLGALDQAPADNLGISTAISDSFMLAGAWWEEGDMPGLQPITSAGAVYVYKLQSNGDWAEVQKLVSLKREALGYFGFSVAIEGHHALVGAYNEDVDGKGNAGRVYAYKLDPNGTWRFNDTMLIKNARNGDEFGRSISLTEGYALIGAHAQDFDENDMDSVQNAGAAYLFKLNQNGKWSEVTKLVPDDRAAGDNFGKFVDIDRQGLLIGAHDADVGNHIEAGSAYGSYCENPAQGCGYDDLRSADLQKISISDASFFEAFGWDVAVSGRWAVIGKSGETRPPPGGSGKGNGAAYFFHWENGSWVEKQKVYASDHESSGDFGRSIDIDGKVCVIGAGFANTDANHGNTVFGAGAAHIFELNSNGKWVERAKLAGTGRVAHDLFGEAVAVWGRHIVVGAWLADTVYGAYSVDAGAVYTFKRDKPLAIDALQEWTGISVINSHSSNGLLEIHHSETSPVPVSIEVYGVNGQVLFSEKIKMENSWKTDLSYLSSGFYFVKIQREGFMPGSWKWVKK